MFGKITSKNVGVSCTLCAWPPHCLETKKVQGDSRVLACNFAKHSPILNFFHWQTQQQTFLNFVIDNLTTP